MADSKMSEVKEGYSRQAKSSMREAFREALLVGAQWLHTKPRHDFHSSTAMSKKRREGIMTILEA